MAPNKLSPYTQPMAHTQTQNQQKLKPSQRQDVVMDLNETNIRALVPGIPAPKHRMGSTELCSLITLYMDLPPKSVSRSKHEAGKLKTLLPWQILKSL